MTTVAAHYECLECLRFVRGGDARWSLPNRAIMTMDVNVLREKMDGPDCPHCGARLREVHETEGDTEK